MTGGGGEAARSSGAEERPGCDAEEEEHEDGDENRGEDGGEGVCGRVRGRGVVGWAGARAWGQSGGSRLGVGA